MYRGANILGVQEREKEKWRVGTKYPFPKDVKLCKANENITIKQCWGAGARSRAFLEPVKKGTGSTTLQ